MSIEKNRDSLQKFVKIMNIKNPPSLWVNNEPTRAQWPFMQNLCSMEEPFYPSSLQVWKRNAGKGGYKSLFQNKIPAFIVLSFSHKLFPSTNPIVFFKLFQS